MVQKGIHYGRFALITNYSFTLQSCELIVASS